MENVNKLKMLYDLASALNIQVVVPPPTTNALAPVVAPILAVETSTFVPEVDQLVDVVATLIVEDLSASPILTKMVWDESYDPPRRGFSKRNPVEPETMLWRK